jgi:hypothetical protein
LRNDRLSGRIVSAGPGAAVVVLVVLVLVLVLEVAVALLAAGCVLIRAAYRWGGSP